MLTESEETMADSQKSSPPRRDLSRREFIKSASLGLTLAAERSVRPAVPTQIASYPRVGIARCKRYDFDILKASLATLFDGLTGIQNLVNHKTVTVKVNLTSYRPATIYTLPVIDTIYTHPLVTLAACKLFEEYGAARIIICESLPTNDETKTAFYNQGYDPALFESMLRNVMFENTRNRGTDTRYRTFPVGDQPYVYKSFDLNYCYYDTDVMVSIAKLKNHDIAGITLTMKNLFGITPNSIYGDPGNERATQVRMLLHNGNQRPAADGEILPAVSVGNPGFRIPRIVTDICRARPIDLAIVDGIVSQSGGEGSWNGQQLGVTVPNLLIAGKNCVATDAVGTAVMGFDPTAADWTKPFYNGANTFRLANERGMGPNSLEDIEVFGLSVDEARYNYLPGKKNS